MAAGKLAQAAEDELAGRQLRDRKQRHRVGGRELGVAAARNSFALLKAAKNDDVDMVELLLKAGVRIDTRGRLPQPWQVLMACL